jgi:membrane protein YdbS with pleckstrin-like domain
VHIASATAASGIEAHIDGVDKATADGLKKFLLDKMAPGSVNSGNGSMGNANIGGASQQQSAQSVSFNFSEELSSAKYPLSSKWFGIEIVNRFVGALLTPLFLVLIFVGKSKNISIADNLGYIGLAYAALFIGIFMWRIISLVLWKKNYAFNFTPEHIYYKDGVISISEKHMPYSSIQDVTVKQGVLDRLFGLADVRIENAATQSIPTGRGQIPVFSGVLLQGLTLVDANKITDILKTTVLGRNSSKYGL